MGTDGAAQAVTDEPEVRCGVPSESSVAEAILSAITEAVGSGSSLEQVLTGLATAAREIAEATYAAIGIPEPDGEAFAAFIHVGMDDDLVAEMGPLPRTHGLLDAMLRDPAAYRTNDVTTDPRFRGWWPASHPRMRSFLGVPIVARDDVIGAFYLTDKVSGNDFSPEDEDHVRMLATHAAAAIENARMFEDSRALALSEERDRMARELHDALNQSLFSLSLMGRAALSHLKTDPDSAAEELAEVIGLARRSMGELRTVIDGLRSSDLERDGLVPTVRSLAELLSRAYRTEIEVVVEGDLELEAATEHELYRIIQEALTNAVRHGQPRQVDISLTAGDEKLEIVVKDDGTGFDPGSRMERGRRLGLTSMRERAAGLGGAVAIDSQPGSGTTVRVEVPHG